MSDHHAASDLHRQLAALKASDFDGHTEFSRLTPVQRLDWLWKAVQFIQQHGGNALMVAEKQTRYQITPQRDRSRDDR